MSFSAGDLVASIRMDGLPQFEQDNARAQRTFEQTGRVGKSAGDAAKAAFAAVAVGVAGASVAGTAYLTSLVKAGGAYNTLQQTSRAALKTILGGTEAANDQMAKMDAFARNSPFSKAVFLQAQQQMLGFGIEAKKVIPYLQSIQDAVAATGGSNQQISELTLIMSQISAASKITGQDLLQFAGRGVDAAGLIGAQMGKTGAEIRAQVSAGTLDAGQALDALAAGMAATYGGAAAGVKATWTGTVDRIKAANREIGSALAEPFISQQGGGLAITWGNQVADVLRAVLTHAQPIVQMFQNRLMPSFATFTAFLDRARVTIKAWDSKKLENFLNVAAENAPAIGALAGGLVSLVGGALPVIGPFVKAIGPLPAIIVGLAAASPELRSALGELVGAFAPLVPVAGELALVLSSGLNSVLPVVIELVRAGTGVLTPFVQAVANLPAPVLAGVVAFVALESASGPLVPVMDRLMETLGRVPDAFRALSDSAKVQAALGAMEGKTGAFTGALGVAAKATRGLGGALKAVFIANAPALAVVALAAAIGGLVAMFAAQAEQVAKARERVVEYRNTLTEAGETTAATADKVRESVQAFAEVDSNIFSPTAITRAKDWVSEIGGAEKALLQFGTSSGLVAETVRDGGPAYEALIASLEKYGAETEKIKTAGADGRGGMREVLTDSAHAANLLRDSVVEEREAIELAAEIQVEFNRKQREAAAAMTETERSNARMNAALEIARDVTRDATERLGALKQALDELNGGTKTQADLEQDLNDRTRSLADAFSVADDTGKKLGDSLVLANGQIDTQTEAGSRLRDQIMGLRDDYLDAMLAEQEAADARGEGTVSVEKAREIHAKYAGTLADAAREAGVAEEKIDDLVAAMLETPEVTAYALTDNGTVDAEKLRLLDLARQIRDTPDKEFEVDAKDLPSVMESLSVLGVKIEDLPEGQVKVKKDDNSFADVEYWLNSLTTTRTVKIHAQAGSAAGGMLPSADGNLIAAGRVQAFMYGGFPSGIYAGRPGGIHKFAEPETIWEAYISGRPSARERNKKIASQAVERLGGVASFANGGITGLANTLSIAQDKQRLAQQVYQAAKAADDRARAAEKVAKKGDSKAAKEAATEARQKASKALSDAKSKLSSADSAVKSATSALNSAKESMRDVQTDWATAMRRSEPQKADGLSLVDKLFDIASAVGGKAGEKLRASALKSEGAFLKLAKAQDAATEKTNLAQTALAKAADVLQGLKDKAAQMASSIASAVRGLFQVGQLGQPTVTTKTSTVNESQTVGGITLSTSREVTEEVSTPATAASIASSMAATAASMKRFADKLSKLAKKGLSPALLAEIASLGVTNGEPIVDVLLTATAGELASINSSYAAIDAASAAAGTTVSDANYSKLIEKAEAQVVKAEANVKATEKAALDIQKKLEAETTRIIREITGALKTGTSVTVPKKAFGGPIIGPGSALSDSVPILASNGEHMWTAREVVMAGGHANVERIRRAVLSGALLAGGGPVVRGTRMGRVSVATRGPGAAYGDSSAAAREGDVHLHMHALPQQGEPLGVQALRAARRLELRSQTRR